MIFILKTEKTIPKSPNYRKISFQIAEKFRSKLPDFKIFVYLQQKISHLS